MKGAVNGVRAARLKHVAQSTSDPRNHLNGDPARPIEHGRTAYRSGKCKCALCKADHNAGNKETYANRKGGGPTIRERTLAKMEQALALLQDGCTYREVAATVRVDDHRLAKAFPEFKGNSNEWASVRASIFNKPELRDLYREINSLGAS
jgi:hypothetical protein